MINNITYNLIRSFELFVLFVNPFNFRTRFSNPRTDRIISKPISRILRCIESNVKSGSISGSLKYLSLESKITLLIAAANPRISNTIIGIKISENNLINSLGFLISRIFR